MYEAFHGTVWFSSRHWPDCACELNYSEFQLSDFVAHHSVRRPRTAMAAIRMTSLDNDQQQNLAERKCFRGEPTLSRWACHIPNVWPLANDQVPVKKNFAKIGIAQLSAKLSRHPLACYPMSILVMEFHLLSLSRHLVDIIQYWISTWYSPPASFSLCWWLSSRKLSTTIETLAGGIRSGWFS